MHGQGNWLGMGLGRAALAVVVQVQQIAAVLRRVGIALRTFSPCGSCIRRPPGHKSSVCKSAGVQCQGTKKPPVIGCGSSA